jgi:hypothetical protein
MQMQADENPPISWTLRAMTLVEALVLAGAGGGLYVLPDSIAALWPWPLLPFNARFLGAVYLSALAAIALVFARGRWSPARPVLLTIFVFTAIVLAVSLARLQHFDLARPGAWAWLALYTALPTLAGVYLWRYRRWPAAQAAAIPNAWRGGLAATGALLCLYGAGLLVAPALASGFWPWRIDAFHSQLYSATFLSGGAGLLALTRTASPAEIAAAGTTQALLGLLALAGLLLADATAKQVDWLQPGTWLWIAIFGLIACAGAAMLLLARTLAARGKSQQTHPKRAAQEVR